MSEKEMSLRVKRVMMKSARVTVRLMIRVRWKNCVLSVGRERKMIVELRLGCL